MHGVEGRHKGRLLDGVQRSKPVVEPEVQMEQEATLGPARPKGVPDPYLGVGGGDPTGLDLQQEVTSADLRQVLDTIQKVQRQNDHLQAQVEYLCQMQDFCHGQLI